MLRYFMAVSEDEINIIKVKYRVIKNCLSEKGRRLWAAVEANAYGWGGVTLVGKASGLSNATVHRGMRDLLNPSIHNDRVRQKGGGRKSLKEKQPGILEALDALVEPLSKGNPENPLRWTSKSVRKLSLTLGEQGFTISKDTVGTLLHELGYSLQVNKKTLEKSDHVDRDEQFKYINKTVSECQKNNQPTISVDAKKKENIGNYKNNGQEYSQSGKPIEVKGHDFIYKTLGKVTPYGVYDIGDNSGWVSVGISSDTAQFAINTIRAWWHTDGVRKYPDAKELLITADCGGSNSYRSRLWKVELQHLSNELQMEVKVRYFPPGTSKWNKIEHRLFSYISQNWRGKPLISRGMVVNLISNTTTITGLTVSSIIDKNEYMTGIKITDEEMNKLDDEFHPDWNYSIIPETTKSFN